MWSLACAICLVALYSQRSAMCTATSSLGVRGGTDLILHQDTHGFTPIPSAVRTPPDDALARFLRLAALVCRARVDHDL